MTRNTSSLRSTPLYLLLPLCLSCSEHKSGPIQATSNPDSLAGKQVYLNPADGKAYQTEGAFKSYTPEEGVVQSNCPAALQKIVLLTDETTLTEVIDIDTLDRYLSADSSTLNTVLKTYNKKGELLIQFTLYATKKPLITVSYDGDFDTTTLRRISDQLNRNCSRYRTRKDSCTYQTFYHTGF